MPNLSIYDSHKLHSLVLYNIKEYTRACQKESIQVLQAQDILSYW